MKITTHVRPHLDEVCAVWLIRRFWAEAAEAPVDFINNSVVPPDVNLDPTHLYVGVGRGRFDEHRGAMGECAAGLVWAELRPVAAIAEVDKLAVDRLVAWVLADDLGQFKGQPGQEFSATTAIYGSYLVSNKSSETMTNFGLLVMDGLFAMLRQRLALEADWDKRQEFTSRFCPAVAFVTDAEGADAFAYAQGFPLALIMNHAGTYRAFRASAPSGLDLSTVAEAVRQREPERGWFLHHSKSLLIHGGEHGRTVTPSNLTLEEMIALAT